MTGSSLPDYAPAGSPLARALTLHRSGKFAEGEALYRHIIAEQPADCHALHLLGVLLMQTGRARLAVPLIKQAIAIKSDFPQACNNLGAACLALNELDEAATAFRRAVELQPDSFDAWFNLGLALLRLGRMGEAVTALERAKALNAKVAEVHCNLGHAFGAQNALGEAQASYLQAIGLNPTYAEAHAGLSQCHRKQGRMQEALASARKAAEIDARSPAAHYNLAVLCRGAGLDEEAVASFERAIALKPDFADALNNLGNCLRDLGRNEDAAACYRRAIAADPKRAMAHNNLGSALYALDQVDDAIASYRRAIDLQPDLAAAHNNLGEALRKQESWDEARAAIERALQLDPDFAQAHYNMGLVLDGLEDFDGAIAGFSRAIELQPDFSDAHLNKGNALRSLKRLSEALQSLDRASALAPGDARIHANRGNVLRDICRENDAIASGLRAVELGPELIETHHNLAITYVAAKRWDKAVESSRRALAIAPENLAALNVHIVAATNACDWTDLDSNARKLLKLHKESADLQAFAAVYLTDDPAVQLAMAAQTKHRPSRRSLPRTAARRDGDRLNIAYLSADFRQHPVASLMVRLFELHDRKRFIVHGLSTGQDDGTPLRKRVVAAFDNFVEVGSMSDAALAAKLRELEIDIVIELGGHTQDGRLMALRDHPVPVQVTYLGYPGTSGMRFMDYTLVDRFVVPPEGEQHFSEKLAYLPDTMQPNDDTRSFGGHSPVRSDFGLPQDGFVFCSFNNSYKFNPTTFDIWMRLLAAVPGSVLWLARNNQWAEANLRREAAARGIDGGRLVFAGRTDSYELHLARLRLADLFLDTWPYNAHTTASDALWAGLPLLTYAGRSLASRVAGSLLQSVGLPELITYSPAEYEAMASRLAREPGLLAGLRDRLAAGKATTPLFDSDRFRRHVEAAYLEMWARHQRGEAPQSFAVQSLAG